MGSFTVEGLIGKIDFRLYISAVISGICPKSLACVQHDEGGRQWKFHHPSSNGSWDITIYVLFLRKIWFDFSKLLFCFACNFLMNAFDHSNWCYFCGTTECDHGKSCPGWKNMLNFKQWNACTSILFPSNKLSSPTHFWSSALTMQTTSNQNLLLSHYSQGSSQQRSTLIVSLTQFVFSWARLYSVKVWIPSNLCPFRHMLETWAILSI